MLEVITIGSHAGSQAFDEVCHRLLDVWSCGCSFKIAGKATFNSPVVLSFGWSLWYFASTALQM